MIRAFFGSHCDRFNLFVCFWCHPFSCCFVVNHRMAVGLQMLSFGVEKIKWKAIRTLSLCNTKKKSNDGQKQNVGYSISHWMWDEIILLKSDVRDRYRTRMLYNVAPNPHSVDNLFIAFVTFCFQFIINIFFRIILSRILKSLYNRGAAHTHTQTHIATTRHVFHRRLFWLFPE